MEKEEEFNSLRENIKKRIDDLDIFFEDNFDNEFITYFEKGRYKLKKLIQYEPNLINEIDNGNNMKAYILGQNSKDNFLEQDSDININNSNYNKKNKNKSKSCKIFPENNLIKNDNINNYITTNKIKLTNDSNRNMNYNNYNYNNKNYKWQKNIKNRIFNNYYNKDIRKKYSELNNSEDSNANKKENKVKYIDWTENNSIQGNTLSVKSNKISNSTNTNFNTKKKFLYEKNLEKNIKDNNKDNIKDNFGDNIKENNYKEINAEEMININFLDDNNSNKSKSSKSQKRKIETDENDIDNIINREILFEIKLTEEEYNMLLKQKAKKDKTFK